MQLSLRSSLQIYTTMEAFKEVWTNHVLLIEAACLLTHVYLSLLAKATRTNYPWLLFVWVTSHLVATWIKTFLMHNCSSKCTTTLPCGCQVVLSHLAMPPSVGVSQNIQLVLLSGPVPQGSTVATKALHVPNSCFGSHTGLVTSSLHALVHGTAHQAISLLR